MILTDDIETEPKLTISFARAVFEADDMTTDEKILWMRECLESENLTAESKREAQKYLDELAALPNEFMRPVSILSVGFESIGMHGF